MSDVDTLIREARLEANDELPEVYLRGLRLFKYGVVTFKGLEEDSMLTFRIERLTRGGIVWMSAATSRSQSFSWQSFLRQSLVVDALAHGWMYCK
jgi:hypothetical protein